MTARLLGARNPEGLRRLLTDHGGRVRGALKKEFGQLLDASDIDAALNQAAHRVWERAAMFDDRRGPLAVWFLAIARNCARLTRREQRRSAAVVAFLPGAEVAALAIDDAAPESTARRAADERFRTDFRTCVDELPRLQRLVVEADLRAGGSAPAHELADELATSTNTIYVSRANARRTLRLRMRELGHA